MSAPPTRLPVFGDHTRLAGRASILRGVILIGTGIEIFITGIIGGRNQNDAPSMSDRVFLILSLTEGAFQI